MGRFSTTVQVKNSFERTNFASLFCDTMKKRGLVKCSEDEAAQSYLLAFGEGWATLASGEYNENPQKSCDDARNIAAALNTSAFSVEVVDSDFALLKLCASNGGRDEVIVGDSSGYGIEKQPRGTQAFWQPLLAEGRTWEQFTETAAKNAAFAEDTLAELAEILGIEPRYICADFYDIAEKAGGNVMAVYFRKAAKAKSMSLNAAFKQVFGEALEPLGFKLIKSKYPYFVRVVPGGEIIHVITYMEEWCPYPGKKKFNVISGIATVYRYKIDLSCAPKDNCGWLYSIARFYAETTPESEFNNEYRLSICHFTFDENVENSMNDTLNNALEQTLKYILPQLDTAVDLKSSLTYLKRLGQSTDTCNFNSKLNFSGAGDESEGFLYVKVDDEEFKTLLKNMIDGTVPSDEESRQRAEEKLKFFDDPVIHEKVLLELERRKAANMEILKIYGLFL